MPLPAEFAQDGIGDLGIGLGSVAVKKESGAEADWARGDGGVIGEISPPPQAFKEGAGGHGWRSEDVLCPIPHRTGMAKRLR